MPVKATFRGTWPEVGAAEAEAVSGLPTALTVTVTLTYRWVPEAFLGGVTLSSTSVMPMSY